jgi:drug/metabolite transporter (DMT)-like permease
MMGGLPLGAPWQASALAGVTQLLNAGGALFLVMALSRGKASIVTPVTNALAPVLTVIVSLIVYQTLPSVFGIAAIVLALGGSTLMVYSDEKRGEALTDNIVDAIPQEVNASAAVPTTP